MKKSHIDPMPKYFDRYINLIDDVELEEAIQISLDELASFEWDTCTALGAQVYAPGKWRVADVLQHLLDWERIMSYRALMFAREAIQKAEGHDEDALALSASPFVADIPTLVAEMTALRRSTRQLFTQMQETQLRRSGICWESQMSALALGFTILGHQKHHFNILRERYFPLLNQG
jgi:hypothetical protein